MDRAVRIQPSADPDQATAQTVDIMTELIHRSAADLLLKDAVLTAVKQYAMGGPLWAMRGINPFEADGALRVRAMAEAIWWYAKHQLKFVHHSKQIHVWLNETDQLQLLIEPAVLMRFPFRMEGDCAIYTMLISAMLDILGIEREIVTAAVDPRQPSVFSHVWPRAILPDGSRIALDASHGDYPGWSVPLDHRYRTQAWDANGFPVNDFGEQRFAGLHGYQRRRGLGDDTVDPTAIADLGDSSTTISDLTGPSWVPLASGLTNSSDVVDINPGVNLLTGAATLGNTNSGGTTSTDPGTGLTVYTPAGSSQSGYVAPSQSSAQWSAFATQALKDGFTLAEINSIQPGTVVGANGSILRQTAGVPVPVGNSLSTSLSSISPSYLLFGGLAIAGIFLFSQMGKGR